MTTRVEGHTSNSDLRKIAGRIATVAATTPDLNAAVKAGIEKARACGVDTDVLRISLHRPTRVGATLVVSVELGDEWYRVEGEVRK